MDRRSLLQGLCKIAGKRLPDAYQEIKYIESTGTQWIDTEVGGQSGITAKAMFSYTNFTGPYAANGFVCACSGGEGRRFMLIGLSNNSYFRIAYGDILSNSNLLATINTRYIVEIQYNVGAQSIKVDDEPVISTTSETFVDAGYTLKLFGFGNNRNVPDQFGHVRLNYLSLNANNILVRNFIPCYRKSDNEIGLYDLVSKTFFTNQGTGSFIKGPDV